MLPKKIKLEILTPHAKVYSEEVSSVVLPGTEGYFGVFPGHTPFLTTLKIGEIKITKEGEESYYFASGGVAEVLPDTVSILAETSESIADIDISQAEEARARAQQKIEEGKKKHIDTKGAEIALARSMQRIKLARKRRKI